MSFLTANLLSRKREQQAIDPVRDWLGILFFSILAFMVVVVWNAWAFDRIASGKALGTPVSIDTETNNEFSVEEVSAIFTARAEEMRKYQDGTYSFTDPSR
jgi:hypothetical protein